MKTEGQKSDLLNNLIVVLGVIHVTMGLVLFIGGLERVQAPAYRGILIPTKGEIWPYAVGWLLAGVSMVMGLRGWFAFVGLLMSIFITNMWASLLLMQAIEDERVGLTGTVAYGGYALISSVLFGSVVLDLFKKRARGDG